MRAHNVIVLCSGRASEASSLDPLIERILSLKKNPILVLGPDGDECLRECSRIEECDVVFDPNYQGEVFSGVKAGLFATHGAAFVVQLAKDIAEAPIWTNLESALRDERAKDVHIIEALTQDAGHSPSPYPMLVTPKGVSELKKLAANTPFDDRERVLSLVHPV